MTLFKQRVLGISVHFATLLAGAEDEGLMPPFAELGLSGYLGFPSSRPVRIT